MEKFSAHHAWARLDDGCVTRAYAWAGETIWNQGATTMAENGLGMKCSGYGEDSAAGFWTAKENAVANVEKIPLLAARWSLDPKMLHRAGGDHRRIVAALIELPARKSLAQSAVEPERNPMSYSIELELQKFPKTVALKDGTKATLRPLHIADEKDFHQLFLGIPEPERMFIKHRVHGHQRHPRMVQQH